MQKVYQLYENYCSIRKILHMTLNFATNIKINIFNLLAPEFFFSAPVYKMWIIQEPNTLELWNKLHFEEEKWRVYTMFKIFSTNICWINIQNETFRG